MKVEQVFVISLILGLILVFIGFYVGHNFGIEERGELLSEKKLQFYSGFEAGYKAGLDSCPNLEPSVDSGGYKGNNISVAWDGVGYECVTKQTCPECPLVSDCTIRR